jgi:hypothetical protein
VTTHDDAYPMWAGATTAFQRREQERLLADYERVRRQPPEFKRY